MTLRAVPPPPTSEYYWRKLLNHLFVHEQDKLFEFAKIVRERVEKAEREKQRGRAA